MDEPGSIATFLFTDIEGSSRLWEREPERMERALAGHDALARDAVEGRRGRVVKMTGDGMCAVFDDPLQAVDAALAFQLALAQPERTAGLAVHARCGIHVGVAQQRDNDYFGGTLNRAARIMNAANGGQVLVSQAVVDLVRGRLPEPTSLRDLGSVRLRDLASPERLYQLQHPGLRAEFPALRSLEVTPNNLPQQATSFVGREHELEQARQALRRTRMLTLVGAGGIGKTRLSLQLAAEVLDDYADGAWFVELAPIADPRLVGQVVATVLGVKEEAGRPIAEQLVRTVADKRLLLVLDNCEHLLAACASLATNLLRDAPGLRILASSREPLRIAGEATFPVPALGVPQAGHAAHEDAYGSYAAVRLFVDRALAVLPSFVLDERNGRIVGDICRHLDGIPLAIELAAARVRAIPVDAIAARLGDRFRLLSSGDRTALPRQQTLRALIDWSHDLLSEPERVLLRRLAVFAGGCTIDSAEAVCAGGSVAREDVLELLAGLVDKSLVAADVHSGRYRLLETIRQYAGEKLEAAGEGSATREQHLDFFVALAEEAEPHFRGVDQAAWGGRIDGEHENLLAAHRWCGQAEGGGPKGLRIVNAMKQYWFGRGLLRLGTQAMREALERDGARARDRARSIALFGLGQFCSFAGDYRNAIAVLEESLSVAREIGDPDRVAAALQPLGFAALGVGDHAGAKRHFEESLRLAREGDDPHQLASALNAVAQMRRADGDGAGAEPLYDQVVALGRRLLDSGLIAIGLLNLSMVYIARGAHSGVRIALQEILAIAGETQSMPLGQSALEVAAGFAVVLGEHERALRLFGAAEANTLVTGILRDPADDAFLRPLIAQAHAAVDPATAEVAEATGRELAYESALAEVREWVSRQAGPTDARVAAG